MIGGQYNMLAVDIYKQVIGQQNFEMGAVVSVILLIPAIAAFVVDRIDAEASRWRCCRPARCPIEPKPNRRFDLAVPRLLRGGRRCSSSTIIGVCQLAALVKFWPYDLSLSLQELSPST